MRRILSLAFIGLVLWGSLGLPLQAAFPWNEGFNFRATLAYCDGSGEACVDGADEQFVVLSDYPLSTGGVTHGWVASGSVSGIDRNNALDRRLAGVHYVGDGTNATFRVDLPNTGTFDVRIALGDPNSFTGQKIELKDNTTVFFTCGPVTNTAGSYYDANAGGCTQHTAANWPANNVAFRRTFASTIFNATLTGSGDFATIAHISLSEVAPTGPPPGSLLMGMVGK